MADKVTWGRLRREGYLKLEKVALSNRMHDTQYAILVRKSIVNGLWAERHRARRHSTKSIEQEDANAK